MRNEEVLLEKILGEIVEPLVLSAKTVGRSYARNAGQLVHVLFGVVYG